MMNDNVKGKIYVPFISLALSIPVTSVHILLRGLVGSASLLDNRLHSCVCDSCGLYSCLLALPQPWLPDEAVICSQHNSCEGHSQNIGQNSSQPHPLLVGFGGHLGLVAAWFICGEGWPFRSTLCGVCSVGRVGLVFIHREVDNSRLL